MGFRLQSTLRQSDKPFRWGMECALSFFGQLVPKQPRHGTAAISFEMSKLSKLIRRWNFAQPDLGTRPRNSRDFS